MGEESINRTRRTEPFVFVLCKLSICSRTGTDWRKWAIFRIALAVVQAADHLGMAKVRFICLQTFMMVFLRRGFSLSDLFPQTAVWPLSAVWYSFLVNLNQISVTLEWASPTKVNLLLLCWVSLEKAFGLVISPGVVDPFSESRNVLSRAHFALLGQGNYLSHGHLGPHFFLRCITTCNSCIERRTTRRRRGQIPSLTLALETLCCIPHVRSSSL